MTFLTRKLHRGYAAPPLPLPSVEDQWARLLRKRQRNASIIVTITIVLVVVFWVLLIFSWTSGTR